MISISHCGDREVDVELLTRQGIHHGAQLRKDGPNLEVREQFDRSWIAFGIGIYLR